MINVLEIINEVLKKKVIFRNGKRMVKKKSDKDGFKTVNGKEVRMSATEKRKRSKSQKIGARKRKATHFISSKKRERTNNKRKNAGL